MPGKRRVTYITSGAGTPSAAQVMVLCSPTLSCVSPVKVISVGGETSMSMYNRNG